MRVAALIAVLVVATPHRARAEFVMCIGGQGIVPAADTVLPPHPRIVYYADQNLGLPQKVSAKIDGAAVSVKRVESNAAPFHLIMLEIESNRSGALVVTFEGRSPLRWTIRPLAMPKEVTGVAARYQGPSRTGERGESFDGMAIRLTEGTPAILAHVKAVAKPDGAVLQATVPVYTVSGESRPMVRIGQFDCASNIPIVELRDGFDLEVTVTLVDGSTRKVTGLAPHMTVPAPLPPQPRPRNQRVP